MKLISWLKNKTVNGLMVGLLSMAVFAVSAQPVARFSGTSLTGCAPILVRFTDESTGSPDCWKWDLGNGTISYLQNPSVTYFVPGQYNIKLLVKNIAGSDSVIRTGYVHVYAAPVVAFSAPQTSGCNTLSVNFNNQSSPANTWQWDFGDGVFSYQESPSHFYSQTGSYNVSLKAVNSDGCQSTLVKQTYVNIHEAKASFLPLLTDRCSPTKISFQNNSTFTGRPDFKWYFGNGDSSAAQNPVYDYGTGGDYIVQLVVTTQEGCRSIFSDTLHLTNKVSATFTADVTNACKAPATIRFTNEELAGNSYAWKVNDSISFAGSNPARVFRDTGFYTIKLVVRNSNGCIDSLTKENYIHVQQPRAVFMNLPDSGCAPFRTTLQAAGEEGITGYLWKFDDGSTSTAATPTHQFTTEGYHGVTLITTGWSGCLDTLAMENAVRVTHKPAVDFTAGTRVACGQTEVAFSGITNDAVTMWLWNFGDNAQEFNQYTTHRFIDTGFLSVQLVAYNGGCADTVTKQNYVYIKPSIAKLKFDFDCPNPFRFSFTNLSLGAERWVWNFGDNTTSSELNPVHVYSDTGTYKVSLTTYNTTTGCEGYRSKTVYAIKARPSFFAADSSVCKNSEVLFTANAGSDRIRRYIWFFGDGENESTSESRIAHTYAEPGVYDVMLVIVNEVNCRDTLRKQAYIKVNSVRAGFGTSVSSACANTPVVFYDSSVAGAGNLLRSWQWSYGDGTTEIKTAPPFTHTYSRGGNFTVRLTVTDNHGCIDSYEQQTLINIKKPSAAFWPLDTVKCSGSEIKFVCPFAEPGVRYYWNFGDDSTAAIQMPRHRYAAAGTYSVQLRLVTAAGCADSMLLVNRIKIVDPVAAFTMSDSFRNCPPLITQFTNQSLNGVSELWDFGDGTSTSEHSPSHFYAVAGTFTVSLTVTGAGGCSAVMRKQVVVKGPSGSIHYSPTVFCKSPADISFTARTNDAVSYIWDFNDGATVVATDSVITHRYNNTGAYLPRLLLSDNSGCRVPVLGTDTIRVINLKAKFEHAGGIVCSNDNLAFTNTSTAGDSITGCHWTFGDGSYAENIAGVLHGYTNPGTYYPSLTVTTLHGCRDSFSTTVPVTVAALPAFDILSSGNGCAPLNASFNAQPGSTTVPVTIWQWDFGNGNTAVQQTPSVQLYQTASEYTVTLKGISSQGCSKTVSKTITAFASPLLTVSADTSICKGGSAVITAGGATILRWDADASLNCTACAVITAMPQKTSTYTVTGTSPAGCTASQSVTVTVKDPVQMRYSSIVQACAGVSTVLPVTGAAIYEWSPSTGLSSTSAASPSVQAFSSVTYRVIGRDAAGCSADTGYIAIAVNPLPQVDAGTDKTITRGAVLDLVPVVSADVTMVHWSPTGDISRDAGDGITVKPLVTTEYTATARTAAGCMASDKVTVTVTDMPTDGGLFVPNTFSPNNDGVNDVFYVRSSGGIKINRIKVMNRNGQTVFEKTNLFTNDITAGWNGTFRGIPVQNDVYLYAVEITDAAGKIKIISGNVSVMR